MKKLFVSLENNDAGVAITDERIIELESTLTTGELSQQHNSLEEVSDIIDNGIDDITELTAIKDKAAESEGAGLSEDAAAMAQVAVEAICGRLGYKVNPVVSLESYTKAEGNHRTKLAVEGLSDIIRKAWEAIKRFFMEFWDKLVALLESIINSVKRTDEVLEQTKQAVKENATQGKEVDLKLFCISFSADSVEDLTKNIKTVLDNHVELLEYRNSVLTNINETLKKVSDTKNMEELNAIVEAETAKNAKIKLELANLDNKANDSIQLINNTSVVDKGEKVGAEYFEQKHVEAAFPNETLGSFPSNSEMGDIITKTKALKDAIVREGIPYKVIKNDITYYISKIEHSSDVENDELAKAKISLLKDIKDLVMLLMVGVPLSSREALDKVTKYCEKYLSVVKEAA